MNVASPFMLAFAVVLAGLTVYAVVRAHKYRRRVTVALRGAAATLTLLAVAQAGLSTVDRGIHTAYLLDVSASVSDAALARGLQFIERSIGETRAPDTATMLFVADGVAPVPGDGMLRDGVRPSAPPNGATRIVEALDHAVAALPFSGDRRVVLVGDGNGTDGDAASAARRLAEMGVRTSTVLLDSSDGSPDARITALTLPTSGPPDSTAELRIAIWSDVEATARLVIRRDGRERGVDTLRLNAGHSVYRYRVPVPARGFARYEAQIDIVGDRLYENNIADGWIGSRGDSSILYLSADDTRHALAAIETQGRAVNRIAPDALDTALPILAAYDAVVMDDVSAERLSLSQMNALERYVRHTGGGLLFLGGPRSLSDGEYRGTTLEDILPITFDVASPVQIPSLVILFLIDKSGSMEGGPGAEVSKLQLVLESVLASVEVMQPNQRVGVIAFDSEVEWTVPITRAAERQEILRAITSLQGGGGTVLEKALIEAHRVLTETEAVKRHVIVLSDGLTVEADFRALASSMRQSDITVSTVGIGTDADTELLDLIAREGAGRFYHTVTADEVPRIFALEANLVSRAVVVEETFFPVRRPHSVLLGLEDMVLPPLEAFALTFPRERSTQLIDAPEGQPLLAAWQYGLGRSVSFSSSVGGSWGPRWGDWTELPRLLGQTLGWLAPAQSGSRLEAGIEGGEIVLTAELRDETGSFLNDAQPRVTLSLADGGVAEIPLEPSAPGRFSARSPLDFLGTAVATLSDPEHAHVRAVTVLGRPYAPEYARLEADAAAMRSIAAAGGGVALSDREDAMPHGRVSRQVTRATDRRELWPWFLAATAILVVVEIATTIFLSFLDQRRREREEIAP
ncbi:MAG: VWA domain-containing protein [Spirochaetales bacterium]|nr:VWA domain-containing protein [Spirochaetales bacterium]